MPKVRGQRAPLISLSRILLQLLILFVLTGSRSLVRSVTFAKGKVPLISISHTFGTILFVLTAFSVFRYALSAERSSAC